jgi:hypothetical protein
VPFSAVVASFTDDNLLAPVTDFQATIQWGAGQTSAGLIVPNHQGGYDVRGTHSYPTGGTYSPAGGDSLHVTITDVGGSQVAADSTAIVAIPTNLTITPSLNTSVYGQGVLFKVVVGAQAPATGTPTGTVQLQIDGANFGTPVSLTNGAAQISTAALLAGTHSITTVYTSDSSKFLGSTATTPVSLVVSPAPLTITADSKSMVYGGSLPTLTASYSGFVNGDTVASLTTAPTLSTAATAGSHVGGYAITASGAAAANYTITYVGGTLSVTPAPLTITANNQTMVYGGTLPTLTASYAGFVNGDGPASLTTLPTLSTTAAGSSPPGTYAIMAAGAADPDYLITYVSGTLTVSPGADVSGQVKVTASGLVYNRATGLFGGTITLTNTGPTALTGRLMVLLTGLPAGVTLANASGYTADGTPFLLVSLPNNSLAPGSSITFSVQFYNPSRLLFSYGISTYLENPQP